MNEPLPPYDANAEASVLAALLVDPDAPDAVDGVCDAADFFRDEHRWVFSACMALAKRGETVNQVTVAHELSRETSTKTGENLLEKLPGKVAFLSRLIDELPTPVGVEHYAAIVRRDATYRRAIGEASAIIRRAYQGGPDLDGFLRDAERRICSVETAQADGFVSIGELVDAWWERGHGPQTGLVRTGISTLDERVAGIVPGNLVICAAQTGRGKSMLLLNIARNVARGQNFRVAIFSLEMSRDEWERRLLARESGIAIDRIAMRALTSDEERRLMVATGELHELPVVIDDTAHLTLDAMRTKLRRLRARQGVDLVLVDYLQLLRGPRSESRQAEVAAISRGLKTLARELDVPIIAAAQLSREVDKREPPKPRLSDLRESGAIEQDADVVMFIYRADKWLTADEWRQRFNTPYPAGVAELIVAKHRNGPTGSAYVRMADATATVTGVGEREEVAAPWAR